MTIASKRRISIRYQGRSYSTAMVLPGFEFVPFTLLDNALKYSPNNNDITINHEETDRHISFSVNSIGPNIRQEEIDKIFFSKFRGQAAIDSGQPGTGYGLYTCKRTLEKSGGLITVSVGDKEFPTSKGPCRDITFHVHLPLKTKQNFEATSALSQAI